MRDTVITPSTPMRVPEFIACLRESRHARGWIGAAGNVGYVSVAEGAPLPNLAWPAITLRGDAPLWPGVKPRFDVMARVKAALDPQGRFPNLDD